MNSKYNEKYSLFPAGKGWPAMAMMRTSVSILVLIAMGLITPVFAQDSTDATDAADAIDTTDAADTTDANEAIDEEIVVTGMRGMLQSAQNIKFDSDTIVDSIVADDIANLPDRSLTETLQRIPGVTIDRFISKNDPEHLSGEGTGVSVRGLTQVKGLINGREGTTANGGRTLSFEDVPPELLGGVDVYKTPTADMIEGGLGGTVNLRTRMPFDIDGRLISFTATANYQNFIEETTPGFSALYSDRWDTGIGEVGLLVDLAYSELEGRIDVIFNRPFFPYDDGGNTVYIPRGADWRTERTSRDRQGTYAALQIAPSDDLEYFLTVFRSEYDFTWDEDALFVDNDPLTVVPSADSVYDSNGVFVSGTLTDPTNGGINMGSDFRVSRRNSITTDVSMGAEWQANSNWLVNTDIQYVKATTDGFDSTVAAGVLAPSIGVVVTDGAPEITTDAAFMADPNNYHFAFTMDHEDDNKAEQLAWRGDAEYSIDDSSFLNSIKFGVRYSDKDFTTVNTGYNWNAVIQPWMRWWALDGLAPLPTIADFGMLDQVHTNNFSNFFRGDISVPGSVVAPNRAVANGFPGSYVAIHEAAAPYYLCCFATIDPNGDMDNSDNITNYVPTTVQPYHVNFQDEVAQSAYTMLRFGWDDLGLDGNIGVRWVRTQNTASGTIHFETPDAPQNVIDFYTLPDLPVRSKNTYTHTLPSLNLRWSITDELLARFAWSKAIARPNISDLQSSVRFFVNLREGAPDGSADPLDYEGSATASNPNLRDMEADQMDLSLEWYYEDVGSVWLNLFEKDIENFIRNATFFETYSGIQYRITRPLNQDEAEIDGWELGWRHFFDSGFGIEASYTKINSETTAIPESIPRDTDGTLFNVDSLPFEGLSENSYSVTLMYESNLVSTRLAYTWRDEFLLSVGPTGYSGDTGGILWNLPVFQDEYGQWDGSIFFNLSDNFSLGLEANNLTNEEISTIQRQVAPGDHIASMSVQDTRYAITLRGKFE